MEDKIKKIQQARLDEMFLSQTEIDLKAIPDQFESSGKIVKLDTRAKKSPEQIKKTKGILYQETP